MIEMDEIIENFHRCFDKYKDKNIILYMNGIDAEFFPIIEQLGNYKILGVVTNYYLEGTIVKYPIISLEAAVKLCPSAIIIIAPLDNITLIHERLIGTCLEYKIELYSLFGERLSLIEKKKCVNQHPYFNLNEILVKQEIDRHQYIAFDIFHVLFYDLDFNNAGFYDLIRESSDLSVDLKQSFIELRSKIITSDYVEEDIEKLYDYIQIKLGLTNEQKRNLLLTEMYYEENRWGVRDDCVNLLKYAIEKRKKVYLLGEPSLTKTYVVKLLKQNGIGADVELICKDKRGSSSKLDICKFYAEICKGFSSLYLLSSKNNEFSSELYGVIDVCKLYSINELFELSRYANCSYKSKSFYGSFTLGRFASKIFNSPFSLYKASGKGTISSAYELGYTMCGDLVYRFMVWFIKELSTDNIDYVLLSSRDGYLIKQLYDIFMTKSNIEQSPKVVYFYTSRIIATMIDLYSFSDIQSKACLYYGGDSCELLKNRFLLSDEEILPYAEKDYENIWHYFYAHSSLILEKAERLRENYLRYVKKFKISNRLGDKIAFFDFAASGTCQLALEKLLACRFKGYYFYRFLSMDSERRSLDIKAFYPKDIEFEMTSLFMECLFTSPESAVREFDREGTPIFNQESRSKKEIEFSIEMQRGVIDYCKDTLKWGYTPNLDETNFEAWRMLGAWYTNLKIDVFENLVVKDEFLNTESKLSNYYQI
ncbi:hypothetical protein C0033_08585 [Clostridium sp. chh4-2]|uniref:hypothetical protein n=1 Tax=Clostridium sp. chh4-2 TaxID=2067550 RepID=UPI000CCDBBBC|nr:hypothetical protein [Clostridium sp. chh4-2]PNV62604.1 hypothetical protein C0033_08585 [Clostridium sp. chh4-2]